MAFLLSASAATKRSRIVANGGSTIHLPRPTEGHVASAVAESTANRWNHRIATHRRPSTADHATNSDGRAAVLRYAAADLFVAVIATGPACCEADNIFCVLLACFLLAASAENTLFVCLFVQSEQKKNQRSE
jgi:hypothetical protein